MSYVIDTNILARRIEESVVAYSCVAGKNRRYNQLPSHGIMRVCQSGKTKTRSPSLDSKSV
jgi:hypothetical protein